MTNDESSQFINKQGDEVIQEVSMNRVSDWKGQQKQVLGRGLAIDAAAMFSPFRAVVRMTAEVMRLLMSRKDDSVSRCSALFGSWNSVAAPLLDTSHVSPLINVGRMSRFVIPILCLFLMGQPCFGFWPPVQNVAAWATTSDGQATIVHFKALDPKTGNWSEDSWSSWSTADNIVGPNVSDGVVYWNTWNDPNTKAGVYFAVYDPVRGYWKLDSWTLDNALGVEFYSLSSQAGVVSWNICSTFYHAFYLGCGTYDPVGGFWNHDIESSMSGDFGIPVVKDGVVAWWDENNIFPSSQPRVRYKIYDPTRGYWRSESWESSTMEGKGSITISNATVTWSYGSEQLIRGYDHNSGAWYSGSTIPFSYFVASPTSGNPPLWVWFTDMSIGATSWGWNFGDGGTSGDRSTWHNYTTPGTFTVTQSVSGPAGSDSSNTTVQVIPIATPSPTITPSPTPTPIPSPTPTITQVKMQNFLIGKEILSDEEKEQANFNQDGVVDIADLIYLINHSK